MVRFSPEHSHHHHHSPSDGFDARSRILAAMVFGLGTVATSALALLGLWLVLAILVAISAGLPLRSTVVKIVALDLFIFVAVATLPFTIEGPTAFTLWGLSASWSGLERGFGIILKATIVVLFALSFIGRMEIPAIGRALYRLKVPDGLVHTLLFTVRYSTVLSEEFNRLRIAMAARHFRPGLNWHSYRTLGYLVGMVFLRGLERSERILSAMKCRGFHGHFHVMHDQVWAARDSALLLGAFSLAGVALLIRVL